MAAAAGSASAWLPRPPRDEAICQLFCLPHAGGGTASFHGWDEYLPAQVSVVPVRPPGRELRFTEPAYSQVGPLVAALHDAIRGELDRPYVLLGHSAGALVAFELARALRRSAAPPPLGLIVSGRPAPQVARTGRAAYRLTDPELKQLLRDLGGVSDEVMANDALLELFLPLLRADLETNENYRYLAEPPLAVPITAFTGDADDKAPLADVLRWREQTCSGFRLHVLRGGHFACYEQAGRFLRLVEMQLGEWLPATWAHARSA